MILLCTQNGRLSETIWRPCLSLYESYYIGLFDITYRTDLTSTFLYSTGFPGDNSQVSGVVVALSRMAATPAGTLTIVLRNTTTNTNIATVTLPVSDLPSRMISYMFFPFSTPVTIASGNYFAIGLSASISNEVVTFRSSSFPRCLVGTGSLTYPAQGDVLLVIPHYVSGSVATFDIEMDRDSTTPLDGIYIGHGCSVDFSRDRNTYLVLGSSGYGRLGIYTSAALTIGTSEDPIPSAYTAYLAFHEASVVPSGSLETQGVALVNPTRALLNSTANAGATSLVLDRNVNWPAGSQIAIAATQQVGQTEVKTLATDASGNVVSLTSALEYMHLGDSINKLQAEVIHLQPYNVTIGLRDIGPYSEAITTYHASRISHRKTNLISASTSYGRYCYVSYAYPTYMPPNDSTSITIEQCNIVQCALLKTYIYYATTSFSGTIYIRECSIYNAPAGCIDVTSSRMAIDQRISDCWFIKGVRKCIYAGVNTFENNRVADIEASSTSYDDPAVSLLIGYYIWPINVRNNFIHTTSTIGLDIYCAPGVARYYDGAILEVGDLNGSFTVWHCNLGNYHAGCFVDWSEYVDIKGLTILGCGQANLMTHNLYNVRLRNLKLGSTPYVTTQYGLLHGFLGGLAHDDLYVSPYRLVEYIIDGAQFGQNSGASRPHSVADILCGSHAVIGTCRIRNLLAGTAPLLGSYPVEDARIIIESWQTSGNAPMHIKQGGIEYRDTTRKRNAPASACLVPVSQTVPLEGYSKQLGVLAGRRYTVRLWCYVSSNFNGTASWVILPDPVLNVPLTTLATITSSTPRNTWVELSNITPELSQDGVLRLAVRCTGTNGSINFTDIEATPID